MPDFEYMVRSHFGSIDVAGGVDGDVAVELAAHLEDAYSAHLAEGATHEAAMALALSEVPDWRRLKRELLKAKGDRMNDRVRKILVPGFGSLVLTMLAQQFIFWLGRKPEILFVGNAGVFFEANWLWLLMLPLCGAMGAYLSRRGGGGARTMLAAATFPAWLMGIFLVVLFPIGVAIELLIWKRGHPTLSLMSLAWGTTLVNEVIVPGLALAIGGLLVSRAPLRTVQAQPRPGA